MGFFSMKNGLKIVFVIIGTLIGAGFASGQEMYIFFFSYGMKGVLGILISSSLMGVIIDKTFQIIKKENIKDYKQFLDIVFPTKKKEQKKYLNFKYMVNVTINLFILITFFIMIAGFGAYLEQELGLNGLIRK